MKNLFVLLIAFAALRTQALPAFPGAEGFGSETPGGRGGKVVFVTTTASRGAGSLYEAMNTAGPRIVIFRVSGAINLQDAAGGTWYWQSANFSNVTFAGQTSPGGVTITGTAEAPFFQYEGTAIHDVIWRHLRFRVETASHSFEDYLTSNVIIDHCDFSGGTDECVDICRSHDVTIQWSTICNSGPTGQLYGLLLGYNPFYDFSIHHNLMANHIYRYPEVHWSGQTPENNGKIDYRNNFVYNCRDYFFYCDQETPAASAQFNYVGNYHLAGPLSAKDDWWYHQTQFGSVLTGYEKDNVMVRGSEVNRTAVSVRIPNRVSTPWPMASVTTDSAMGVYDKILNKVGAWPRDSTNNRTVSEVRTIKGALSEKNAPFLQSSVAAPADADNDGMPDFWEDGMGLNKNSAGDGVLDKDNDGYTNVEEYINDLALARICQDYKNPVYPIPNNWSDYNPSCCKSMAVEQSPMPAPHETSLTVFPSVYSGAGTVRIELNPGSGAAVTGSVSVVDLGGRVRASLQAGPSLHWNGRDRRGFPLAAGIYLVRWESGNGLSMQKRVTVIR